MVGGPDKEVYLPRFGRTIPLLVSEDLPAAHDFLVDAFGCEAGGDVFLLVGGASTSFGWWDCGASYVAVRSAKQGEH